MSTDADRLALIILLADETASRQLAALLVSSGEVGAPLEAVLTPPVRGIPFFADESAQPDLDTWWGKSVPDGSQPVYFLEHDPAAAQWMK